MLLSNDEQNTLMLNVFTELEGVCGSFFNKIHVKRTYLYIFSGQEDSFGLSECYQIKKGVLLENLKFVKSLHGSLLKNFEINK